MLSRKTSATVYDIIHRSKDDIVILNESSSEESMEKNQALTKILEGGLEQLNIKVSPATQRQLLDYVDLLIKWNRVYNLTANANHQGILEQHILDSLSITPYIMGTRILDLGTGAGLPGVPLALVLPDKRFILLDSIGKKIRFLRQVVTELNIKNIEIIQARSEAYSPVACFDTIVTRAVGSVSDIIALTEHLLCPQGHLLLMKGRYPSDELIEISWEYQVIPLQVPGLNKERHLICLRRKISA